MNGGARRGRKTTARKLGRKESQTALAADFLTAKENRSCSRKSAKSRGSGGCRTKTAEGEIETIEPDDCNVFGAEIETDRQIRALQKMINGGRWSFQGSLGRAMMSAIESGLCALGPNRAKDYWGNVIPSRFDVKTGTKGSVEFVNDHGNEVLE